MKTSLNWLNRYLDAPVTADEAAQLLTRVGFPVEHREDVTTTHSVADVQLDVEITSNRSDCLCHLGLAREIAGATNRQLVAPENAVPAGSEHEASASETAAPAPELSESELPGAGAGELPGVVINDAVDLCPLYTARILRGVKVGPSPQWLVDCLEAAGLRSVNNVVDVTNFVLLEMGQPLHAFDRSKLAGGRIVVRRAAKGEAFTAIDGSKHTLDDRMLVIADAERPAAVAGVMGGRDSEVGDATTEILLESARFEPLSVRRTSRKLKLASDSSYRFERGVDPAGVAAASDRATRLILELAGGAVVTPLIRQGEADPEPQQIALRPQRCRDLLGMELTDAQQVDYLRELGLSPELDDAGMIVCEVPTFRLDLQREVDLIEEVARLHGLDRVPVLDRIELIVRPPQESVKARRLLGQVLVAHGFHETITPSFLSPQHAKLFLRRGAEAMRLVDDRRKAESDLRPSALPSLLVCRKANQDAGNHGVKLFEVAAAWEMENGKPQETRQLAMLADAQNAGDLELAVRELRGTIEELVERLAGGRLAATLDVKPVDDPCYAAAGQVLLDGECLGLIGVLSKPTTDAFDLQTQAVAAELRVDPLLKRYPPMREVSSLPRFPGIERDLSVVVDEAVAWASLASTIESLKLDKFESLAFVTVYRGKPIPKGRKSMSLRLTFRDPAGTLRHDEVDPQIARAVEALASQVGAELRA